MTDVDEIQSPEETVSCMFDVLLNKKYGLCLYVFGRGMFTGFWYNLCNMLHHISTLQTSIENAIIKYEIAQKAANGRC